MGAGGMVSNIVGQVGGLVGSTLSAFDSMNKYGGYEKAVKQQTEAMQQMAVMQQLAQQQQFQAQQQATERSLAQEAQNNNRTSKVTTHDYGDDIVKGADGIYNKNGTQGIKNYDTVGKSLGQIKALNNSLNDLGNTIDNLGTISNLGTDDEDDWF